MANGSLQDKLHFLPAQEIATLSSIWLIIFLLFGSNISPHFGIPVNVFTGPPPPSSAPPSADAALQVTTPFFGL